MGSSRGHWLGELREADFLGSLKKKEFSGNRYCPTTGGLPQEGVSSPTLEAFKLG